VHPPPSPGWADFTIMKECTPESGHCHSVTLWGKHPPPRHIHMCPPMYGWASEQIVSSSSFMFIRNSLGHSTFVCTVYYTSAMGSNMNIEDILAPIPLLVMKKNNL